ncbi:MAG: TetR/AcrR family transcriptional regulator [Clostridiales bacterium]|nr:TetR/AcrR family transcriptional regulator [Clostridiales bacterium]
MRTKGDDRRTRYTKRAIRDSFVHLLGQKPLSKITVKEICEMADINRSTFYTHYADPYDLMGVIKGEVMAEINSWVERLLPTFGQPSADQVMKLVFEYVLANADLCKVMLGKHGDASLQREIMMLVQTQVLREWSERVDVDGPTMEYLCLFGVYASMAVVRRWLETGLREPPGEMANLVIRLIGQGLASAMPRRADG